MSDIAKVAISPSSNYSQKFLENTIVNQSYIHLIDEGDLLRQILAKK